ncbi:uncharacterized protein Tco025E_04553 [Trypanosoma conorhini]|uniref:TLC domain-containing protein n=1 Tax=Trypanosoma conorhini TaxID=83891 RepID=A0A3R7L2D6_9TRYP|nr:uncharacterized protein Tco025E_04553 [Trypanosoma conorhini]RNF18274.1 hypothetical protein Tco025E_04553 [Trypanosoma conorhini]
MGRYGAYDLYIAPLVRDYAVSLPMLGFWFALQWMLAVLYTRLLGDVFTRLTRQLRQEVVVRTVSALNGLLMIGAAACFVFNLRVHNFTLADDFYAEIPGYRFFRISIVAYFAWDIIVCFVYRWDLLWKVHAIASFLGAYLLSFPFSDYHGSYFTGMFELSNAPLHISTIMRTLDIKATLPLVLVMEALFAVMFFLIRVLGGTIVTLSWLKLSCARLVENYNAGGVLLHGEAPVLISMLLIVVVQLLQYVWFVEVVREGARILVRMREAWRKPRTD